MKTPILFVENLPIPNLEETKTALWRANHPKWTIYIAFAVLFIGMFVILNLISNDPFGHEASSAYLPWLVLLATIGIIALLLGKIFKKMMRIEKVLDDCYETYQRDPIHEQYEYEMGDFYECLSDLKLLRFDMAHLNYTAKENLLRRQWMAHINPVKSSMFPDDFWNTPRGERLGKYGFYPFYAYYEDTMSLSRFYPKWLSLAEIRTFLAMHRQFRTTFDYQPNAEELAKEALAISDAFNKEEESLLKEMVERHADLLEMRKQRYAVYISFRRKYLETTKAIAKQLSSFKWKEC